MLESRSNYQPMTDQTLPDQLRAAVRKYQSAGNVTRVTRDDKSNLNPALRPSPGHRVSGIQGNMHTNGTSLIH